MNAERARALRYKHGALATIGYDEIVSEMDEIEDACGDVRWAMPDESVIETLDGDEDDENGYRMDFSELSGMAERLKEQLYNIDQQTFDDCTVALIGNRFQMVGYDFFEEDYFSLCSYDAKLAVTESGKRLMRLTKAEMIATIGQCIGVMMSFFDIRQRFDYINAAMGVLLDHNLEILHTVRGIEEAYQAWNDDGCPPFGELYSRLHHLADCLPEKFWVM